MSILSVVGYITLAWTVISNGSGVAQYFSKGDSKFPGRHMPTAAFAALLFFTLPLLTPIGKIQTTRGKNV